MKSVRGRAAFVGTTLWAVAAHAVLLEDTYRFTPQERVAYFGGVYDRASITASLGRLCRSRATRAEASGAGSAG